MNDFSSQSWRRNDSHKSLHKKLVYSLSSGSRIPSWKQFKQIGKVLGTFEKRVVQFFLIVACVNLLFLGWNYYTYITVEIPKSGGTYIEGVVGTPQYINPILLQNNDVDRDLSRLIYSGLVTYDRNMNIVGDLAESYEISPDQKTYTFHLRKGVKWHDGEPFTAQDVIFTVTKIQDPNLRSPLFKSFRDVKVEQKDDFTVNFVLLKPFSPFIDLMTTGILPEHAWQDVSVEHFGLDQKNVKPIGTGPWKYKALQRAGDGMIRSYTMAKNDDYYGSKSYINTMTFKFYPDTPSVIQALKNRNVNGISYLPRDLRSKLEQDKDLKYYTFNVPQNTALFFNQSANADLQSKAVRQALALAIDKNRLVGEVLGGEGRVIDAPILPGFLGYSEGVKKYPLDYDRAGSLLEAAGWKKDEKGLWYRDEKVEQDVAPDKNAAKTVDPKKPTPPAKPKTEIVTQKHYLTVTITAVNSDDQSKTATLVKEMWAKLGVSSDVILIDSTRIKSDVIDARDYQALLYGEIIGADPDLYPFWHSSQARAPGLNLAVFSNKDADQLLEQGRAVSDPKKRVELYMKLQDILAEEVPAIFLYNPSYNYVVKSSIKGINDQKQIVYPSDRFADIADWYIKTSRKWK